MIHFEAHRHGVVLPVRAQAGARKNAILGTHNGMLRVAVTAAPEKGKANQAIILVLSEALGLPKSSFELISGDASPRKRFLVVGGNAESLERKLAELLAR